MTYCPNFHGSSRYGRFFFTARSSFSLAFLTDTEVSSGSASNVCGASAFIEAVTCEGVGVAVLAEVVEVLGVVVVVAVVEEN